jgi:hypothetical protein
MEAVLERKRTTLRFVQQPVAERKAVVTEVTTYETLQQHKREQQRLIALGLMQKPVITDDVLTPEEQAEFDRAISIQEYAALKGIRL